MAEIKFLRGSSSSWNGVEPKNESYFYLVSNVDGSIDLYLGEKLLAKGTSYAELTAEVSRSVAEDERLASLISSLTTDVEGDISAAVANLQSLIQAEKSRAEGQESAIRGEFAAADSALKASILGGVSEDYDTLAELADKIGQVESAAKSYSLVAVTEGLSENVKEAFKLVDEDGLQVGETIKVYKDSSLMSVELKEDQKLYYTYILANGDETTVDIDMSKFLVESEFKNGLQVIGGEVSVKVAEGSEAFLSVDANGVKLSGIQDAIDAAESDAIDAAKEYADGLDSALSDRVKAIEDDYLVEADKTELSDAIAAEEGRAVAKESALESSIQVNANAIAAEKQRAEAKETELTQAIADEIARAEAAKQALQDDLDAEIARAKALKGSGNIEVSMDEEGIQTIGMVWGEF